MPAKVEQILGEKVVEAEKSAEHIRSLEARLQEGDPNREELHKRLTESSKDHALSIVVQNSEVQRLKTLENALLKEVTQLQVCVMYYKDFLMSCMYACLCAFFCVCA